MPDRTRSTQATPATQRCSIYPAGRMLHFGDSTFCAMLQAAPQKAHAMLLCIYRLTVKHLTDPGKAMRSELCLKPPDQILLCHLLQVFFPLSPCLR